MTENLTPPEPSLLSTSFSYIIRVLENSDALAFVVRSSLKQHPCSPIVALDLAYQMPTRRAGIVRRKNAWQSPIELDLIEALRAYCAKDPFQ